MQRQRDVGKARRVDHRKWASSTSVHGRTVGEPPGAASRSRRADDCMDAGGRVASGTAVKSNAGAIAKCAETAVSGWQSLDSGLLPFTLRANCAVRAAPAAQCLLSLGHSRESDSLARKRVKPRQGCRATKGRKNPSIATEVAIVDSPLPGKSKRSDRPPYAIHAQCRAPRQLSDKSDIAINKQQPRRPIRTSTPARSSEQSRGGGRPSCAARRRQ